MSKSDDRSARARGPIEFFRLQSPATGCRRREGEHNEVAPLRQGLSRHFYEARPKPKPGASCPQAARRAAARRQAAAKDDTGEPCSARRRRARRCWPLEVKRAETPHRRRDPAARVSPAGLSLYRPRTFGLPVAQSKREEAEARIGEEGAIGSTASAEEMARQSPSACLVCARSAEPPAPTSALPRRTENRSKKLYWR